MTNLEFTALVALGSLLAGFLGALTGLGGGVVITPLLTLGFGVDIRYAIGASLISVIATSSGAAAAYVKEGYSNIRIGMFLEVSTTVGALVGAFLAGIASTAAIAVVFGLVLLYSAYLAERPRPETTAAEPPDRLASFLRLHGSYPTPDGPRAYHVRHVPAGFPPVFVAAGPSRPPALGPGPAQGWRAGPTIARSPQSSPPPTPSPT